MSYDWNADKISMNPLCEYDFSKDKWKWTNVISPDKQKAAEEEDEKAFQKFAAALEDLGGKS
jgi:hypothetical protein